MRLIGVGFGRTGTMSLKAALERLGAGPCFHMIDLIQGENKERDLPYWIRIANGEMADGRSRCCKGECGEARRRVGDGGRGGWPPPGRSPGRGVPEEPFPRLHDTNEFRTEFGLAPI